MNARHDASYKHLFSSPKVVRHLVEGFIPDEEIKRLDFSTLERMNASYVSEDLRERADDVVWRVRTEEDWLYLYFLIEFQSGVDRWMAVRLMTYVGLLYQDLIKGGQIAGRHLPPVLPIVFYTEIRPGMPPPTSPSCSQRIRRDSLPATCRGWRICSSTRTPTVTRRLPA